MDAISDPRFFVVSFLRIAIVCRVTVDIGHFKYSIIVSSKKNLERKKFFPFSLPIPNSGVCTQFRFWKREFSIFHPNFVRILDSITNFTLQTEIETVANLITARLPHETIFISRMFTNE